MSLFLRGHRIIESSKDDEEDYDSSFQTQHMCPCCQEYIIYTDEVFLVQVVESAQDGGQIVTQPIVSDEGDFLYEPYILHFMCWEELLEQMREITQDQLPVECVNGILYCHCCKSTIAAFEPFVSSQFAEVHRSGRAPNGGVHADKMHVCGDMYPICLACVVHVFEEHFPDWEDLFAQFDIPLEDDDDES